MRFVTVMAAAFLWLPSVAIGQQAVPSFSAKAEKHRSGDASYATVITARGEGCWGSPYTTSGYSDEDYDECIDFHLRLSRNGHVITKADPMFDADRNDIVQTGLASSDPGVLWSCDRTGKFAWKVTYTNDSVPGNPKYAATESGSFTVPRCGEQRPRRVARGIVVQHEADVNEANYPDEFISSIRCSPKSSVKGGKASVWLCLVTHNNTHRQCVDYDTINYWSRHQFGRTVKQYTTRSRKSCHSF